MDFIKRHYEKLLLLFMLVLFIGIMIYVVNVAEQARKIKDSALTFREADLKKHLVVYKSSKEAEFDVSAILDGGKSQWKTSSQRQYFTADKKEVAGTYSDLVASMRIAICPHCKDLIPRYYFRNNLKCPVCAAAMADVPARPKQRRIMRTDNDTDGDGMPNAYESSKSGLNPNEVNDQCADADNDGFSNLFEYENGTDPTNPLSRMPLWYRLRYVSNDSVVLPIVFKAISHQNQLKEKRRWLLQFSHIATDRFGRIIYDSKGKYREDSRPYSINDEIKFDGKTYRIVDATFLQQQVGKDRVVDNSTVKLIQILPKDSKKKPEVFVMQANRDVRSKDERLTVEDVGTPIIDSNGRSINASRRRYTLRVGDTLRIGNRRTKFETYRLRSVDSKAFTALFERPDVRSGDPTKDAQGKKILVTRESEIPEDVQVRRFVPSPTAQTGQGLKRGN